MKQPPPISKRPGSAGPRLWFWIAVAALVPLLAVVSLIVVYFLTPIPGPDETRGGSSDVALREPKPALPEPELPPLKDFSTSNSVTVLLGAETLDDGLKHLANQSDGRTTVETIDGVACRFLSRTNRSFGYLYFTIHDSFKQDPVKTARIEFEFQVSRPALLRLQYDGVQDETHKPYKSAVPEHLPTVQLAPTASYVRVFPSNAWQTMSFEAKNSAFMNSQNGGADFRLEVTPPHIYVRRVTVSRVAEAVPGK